MPGPGQQSDRLIELAPSDIQPNPDQPRRRFNEESLRELAQSIRAQGVIQPVVVRHIDGVYQLIAGERRVRAAKIAGVEKIPARVLVDSVDGDLEKALVENIQREDLNAIHEAKAFQVMLERDGLTQEKVAERVGKSRATVANTLRLLRLPEAIQKDLLAGLISEGHARALLMAPDAKHQMALRNQILEEGLSVRQVERMVRPDGDGKAFSAKKALPGRGAGPADPLVREIEEKMRERFGTRVMIQAQSAKKGKITIPYKTLDDFERILDAMGISIED
jgi:ParB family chromosome partitioning protein